MKTKNGNGYPSSAEYNKLVRDKIPDIIRGSGLELESRVLSPDEVVQALKTKAVEEGKELEAAEGIDDIKKEMSDVLEILQSLAKRLNIPMEDIEALRAERASKRGGFDDGVFLVRTYKQE
jgi:predicted house-cleaning noncanonical NTP pyrophosphatase (MazG superfamily)